MEILDLTNVPDKVKATTEAIIKLRDRCGGLVMALIISECHKVLMKNVSLNETPDDNELYLYGSADQFIYSIYVDKTLTDNIYLIGNTKSVKIKVLNG